ncbi:MAG: tandem-95 repeat protein [Methylococcaceae bacterium]|nr:tandem-95 repeat protein [Methylococcaceae bacterium]
MQTHLKEKLVPVIVENRSSLTFSNAVLLSISLFVGGWSAQGQAVPVTAPVIGEIEKISINDPTDHWSGGVIVAGGQNIIIPKNLLMDLPANRVTLQQLFIEASASCQAKNETGLAKGDTCNPSGTGGIATIHATRIDNGNVIAGDVFIQKGAEVVTGQITYINYDEGYFRINGKLGSASAGVMVRLNDPDSRHTIQQGLGCAGNSSNCSPDPRFALDADNYTNTFTTGFPMCIPSTAQRNFNDFTNSLNLGVTTSQAQPDGTGDVLCPTTNRTINNGQPVDDSRRFAPIMLGDSITVEGNYETIGGVKFLSAHTTMVLTALSTKTDDGQPDYFFLDEVEMDAPGFQNQRARTLIIGYATLAPADVMFWSIHYDPVTNSPHEFPLASTTGCDNAAGLGECTAQGLVGAGANIFKIHHDVDFAATTKAKVNPCAHIQADPRFTPLGACPGLTLAQQFSILSPIPHEIMGRTGRKFDYESLGLPLLTADINGNEATNGQYLFPFGIGLGGVSVPEMNEIDLNALSTPISFTGIPWNLDRRLSPGGCLDNNHDGIGECEATPQPLEPFPFEGVAMDPRTLGNVPSTSYSDTNYTSSALSNVRNRILSFVDPTKVRTRGDGLHQPASGNFTTAILNWQAPPPVDGAPGSGEVTDSPVLDQALICSAATALNSPPTVKDEFLLTVVDTPILMIPVLANDIDINGDLLTITSISSPTTQGGTVVINPDGTLSYTPAAGFVGVDSFTYTVSDGKATAIGTVSVTVNALTNHIPIAVDDVATTNEDTSVPIDVLFNDTDDDSGPGHSELSIVSVVQSVNGGTVVINPGNLTVTYTPKAQFNGVDSFTYVVSDGRGGVDTGLVTVTVSPVNTAPVAVNDNAIMIPGTKMDMFVLTNDVDVDGDNLTVSLATATLTTPMGNKVTSNGAVLSYQAKAGVIGIDTFSYTVKDGHGGVSTATVTVDVKAAVLPDVVTIARSDYTRASSEWNLVGTGTVPGKTVTVRLGTAANGVVVGTAKVDTFGKWQFSVKPGVVPATSVTQVTARSNGGGASVSTDIQFK